MGREAPPGRSAYAHFEPLQTRWLDNDVYGHINNVVFYSYFDTVINRFLIDRGGLDISQGGVIGVAAESHCTFHAPLSFPQALEAGMAVSHIGTSSVRYHVGVFASDREEAGASGEFVHVFVDRRTRRPVAMPETVRTALQSLLLAP
ncbi:MAG: acyl-CoA thioesterase [Acidimicrobiia bacterium]|nr:acyl-CoA thioesterase [Acidimicrobiia bacterium]